MARTRAEVALFVCAWRGKAHSQPGNLAIEALAILWQFYSRYSMLFVEHESMRSDWTVK